MTRVAVALLFTAMARGEAVDPTALLERARAGVRESIARLPKYTCVQTVRRARSDPFYGDQDGARPAEFSRGKREAVVLPAWSDRFRLDVTVSGHTELFSWAGARSFQSSSAEEIVGGGLVGTGDFGPFLSDLFVGQTPATYVATETIDGRSLAAYRFHVERANSGYQIRIGLKAQEFATLAYEGKFWLDPASAELRRLRIVVPHPPKESETTRVETTIDYQRLEAGGARLYLPRSTVLELSDTEGALYENRTTYDNCRAFQSEVVFRTDDVDTQGTPVAAARRVDVKPGERVRIVLASRIETAKAFAGDAIEGRLIGSLRDREGRTVASDGALVRGRIVRLEQHIAPVRFVALGLQLDTVEANGGEIPLVLDAVSRSKQEELLVGPLEKKQGIRMLLLRDKDPVVAEGTPMEWKTRAGAR